MTTQCYVCKKYLVAGQWISADETLDRFSEKDVSGLHMDYESKNISHGLCPACTLFENRRIQKELTELKPEIVQLKKDIEKELDELSSAMISLRG